MSRETLSFIIACVVMVVVVRYALQNRRAANAMRRENRKREKPDTDASTFESHNWGDGGGGGDGGGD